MWDLTVCISTTANLWHRCLGHPNPHILNLLIYSNKIICTSRRSLSQCQAFPLCKSPRLSLRATSHKTIAPLDLILSDVWVFTPLFSSDSFCYFVIFIDAYTKHIWHYPHVVKSDVFSIFHHFQTLVECQFSCKIKSIQTD